MVGFYIGRYEVGDNDLTSRDGSSGTTSTPVEMQGKIGYIYIDWYNAYDICKRLSEKSESVESCLIWGCLWDATLEYLVQTENKNYSDIVDSTNWGNYSNAMFEYISATGENVVKNEGSNVSIRSGNSEYTKSCNIYDLAGNRREWTQEKFGYINDSCTRGGCYSEEGENRPSSVRIQYSYINYNNINRYYDFCCRAVLYVK